MYSCIHLFDSSCYRSGFVLNFAGTAQSARFSPCLIIYPFSLPPHLNNRPLISPPIPNSPLHLSLPSLHPISCSLDTPAPQCSHAPLLSSPNSPSPPPPPPAVVTWCLNSSSLNSATSTLIFRLVYVCCLQLQLMVVWNLKCSVCASLNWTETEVLSVQLSVSLSKI